MLNIFELFLYFVLFSFGGWLYELIFSLIMRGPVHWRGYLTLPLLPIYGLSAVGIVLAVEPYVHNPFLVFVASSLLVTFVEMVSSWTIERLFRVRLWDYTEWPYDFHGRVSLLSSLGFGAMGLLLVYVLHPVAQSILTAMPPRAEVVVAIVLMVVFAIDFVNATASLIRLRVDFARVSESVDDVQEYLRQRIEGFFQSNRKTRARLEAWQRYNLRQLRRAFPRLKVRPHKK